MDKNAYVSWLCVQEPWLFETHLLDTLDLPLNLDRNKRSPFQATLKAVRAEAASHARGLPALPNPGVGGSNLNRRSTVSGRRTVARLMRHPMVYAGDETRGTPVGRVRPR